MSRGERESCLPKCLHVTRGTDVECDVTVRTIELIVVGLTHCNEVRTQSTNKLFPDVGEESAHCASDEDETEMR